MRGSRGGTGGPNTPPPPEIHNNIGFLVNTGPDPLKNHTATEPAFNVGSPFKWRFAGGPMMVRFSGILILPSTHQLKRNVVEVGPPLAKHSGSAHDSNEPMSRIRSKIACSYRENSNQSVHPQSLIRA